MPQFCARLSLTQSYFRKTVLINTNPASLLGLRHTAFRGAFLVLVGGAFILLLLMTQRRKMIYIFLTGVLMFFFFVLQIFLDRPGTASRAKIMRRQAAIAVRIQLAHHGWKNFANNPVFGIGMGNVRLEMQRRFGLTKTTHIVFTQLLSETGAVGFLAISPTS